VVAERHRGGDRLRSPGQDAGVRDVACGDPLAGGRKGRERLAGHPFGQQQLADRRLPEQAEEGPFPRLGVDDRLGGAVGGGQVPRATWPRTSTPAVRELRSTQPSRALASASAASATASASRRWRSRSSARQCRAWLHTSAAPCAIARRSSSAIARSARTASSA
jgi:hypothetical protein